MENPTGLAEVKLLRIPLALRNEHSMHAEELLRELTLIQLSSDVAARTDQLSCPEEQAHSLAHRILALAQELNDTYSMFHHDPNAQMDVATKEGEGYADVVFQLPSSVGDFLDRLIAALIEADEYCQSEHLLTLPASVQVSAYRRWVRDEVSRQLNGLPARAWDGQLQAEAS